MAEKQDFAWRADKDAVDRQRLIDKAERYTENPSLFKSDLWLGGKSYLKVNADTLSLRSSADRITKAAAFDGWYGCIDSDESMTPAEVMATYHSLWQIEESFRISKCLLKARPCFHRKEQRIRGHFLVGFMALVTHRLLEKELEKAGLKLSPRLSVSGFFRGGNASAAQVRSETQHRSDEKTGAKPCADWVCSDLCCQSRKSLGLSYPGSFGTQTLCSRALNAFYRYRFSSVQFMRRICGIGRMSFFQIGCRFRGAFCFTLRHSEISI